MHRASVRTEAIPRRCALGVGAQRKALRRVNSVFRTKISQANSEESTPTETYVQLRKNVVFLEKLDAIRHSLE